MRMLKLEDVKLRVQAGVAAAELENLDANNGLPGPVALVDLYLDQLMRLGDEFMAQFPRFDEDLGFDDWLEEYGDELSDDDLKVGNEILGAYYHYMVKRLEYAPLPSAPERCLH